MNTDGLLVAAGAGRRYGQAKALVDGWLEHAISALRDGGCASVSVVLGAEAGRARLLVPDWVEVAVCDDWASGMSASLQTGLAHVEEAGQADAVVVHLVDLPDVGADVVRRVVLAATGADGLARAFFDGRPGHPVLLGRQHWDGVRRSLIGDRGARDYLATHPPVEVECGDLATGMDVDQLW